MNTASPATPTSPATPGRRIPRRGAVAQRSLRIAALLAATASIAPIAATANAAQVQAATGQQVLAGHSSDPWLRVTTAAQKITSSTAQHVAAPNATAYASIPAARHWSRPLGVTARGNEIAREVHAQFPQIAVMGGYRHEAGSDHNTHRAIDNMLPGNYRLPAQRALGFALADWARANARRLGITYVIWDQHIWNIARDREGWRPMPNRGSDNQNHKNHVHISFR